jgi:hypothetical protein
MKIIKGANVLMLLVSILAIVGAKSERYRQGATEKIRNKEQPKVNNPPLV